MKKLRLYQKNCVLEYMNDFDNPVLFWDMRVGKSTTSCAYIRNLKHGPILIIAPYSAHFDWIEEINQELNIEPVLLYGTSKQRSKLLIEELKNNKRLFIINTEAWRFVDLLSVNWYCIIFDEVHALSNPKSKIHKYFLNNFREVPHRLSLTGSEFKKDLSQVYGPLAWADTRILGFKNFWEFRSSKFRPGMFEWQPKKGTKEWIANRIANWCSKIKRSDVNINTKKVYKTYAIDFSRDMRTRYNTLEKDMVLEYESTKFSVVKHTWLQQLCSGFIDDTMCWYGKITQMQTLFQNELRGERIVIWAKFKNDILKISEKFKIPHIYGETPNSKRKEIIKDFKENVYDKIVLQPSCMGTGINLSNADVSLYYSQANGIKDREQSEDRIVPGSTTINTSKLILDLIVPNTVDEDIRISQKQQKTVKQMFHLMVKRIEKQNA